MPHRVWNEEKNEWVILNETINKALNVAEEKWLTQL